ncbi:proline dipeptidase [Fictibacillus macauensis ZFHKF-1]|uniref:Proline dipeptidase n=1 Tax=Fictibacillus macauensis ZFHKF-1 TaxID=1196324 RepID=I8UF06_9BACL|nr:Xaa-Pro peptidase family protein [Fictibacillus macauensis]EIT85455.1 proline dipeptidase [Fictibacillus macauensis ZFHKF-1]
MKQLTELQNWLKEQRIEGAFITSTANVYYLTGFRCFPHERLLGVFVFAEQDPILVCPGMEVHQARTAGWEGEILPFSDTDHPWDLIAQRLPESFRDATLSIAVEKEHLSYARGMQLLALFPNATLVSAEHQLNEMRVLKTPEELAILRKAAALADYGVEVGVQTIAKGVSELELVAAVEQAVKKRGASEMSFATTILTGANSALPHGKPGLNEIQPGDFVLFDLGVVVDGYCSDITRTVAYQHVSDKQREIYETVRAAQQASLDASKPGSRIGDIDLAARRVIENAGYGDYFPHRIGHGLGLDVHEHPSLNATNQEALKAGMVYTIEPGIYVPEVGGVRIEDDVYITENGHECLTKFTKELTIIK